MSQSHLYFYDGHLIMFLCTLQDPFYFLLEKYFAKQFFGLSRKTDFSQQKKRQIGALCAFHYHKNIAHSMVTENRRHNQEKKKISIGIWNFGFGILRGIEVFRQKSRNG